MVARETFGISPFLSIDACLISASSRRDQHETPSRAGQ